MADERTTDQLSDLRAGQASLSTEVRGVAATLREMHESLRKLIDDHEGRIRRLEFAVIALALGGGTAAAKIMGLM